MHIDIYLNQHKEQNSQTNRKKEQIHSRYHRSSSSLYHRFFILHSNTTTFTLFLWPVRLQAHWLNNCGIMFFVRPSVVRPLTLNSRDVLSLYSVEHISKTCHKFSPRLWVLLKRFSRSEIKGQGYSDTKCTFPAEEYISTVWHRGSLGWYMSDFCLWSGKLVCFKARTLPHTTQTYSISFSCAGKVMYVPLSYISFLHRRSYLIPMLRSTQLVNS